MLVLAPQKKVTTWKSEKQNSPAKLNVQCCEAHLSHCRGKSSFNSKCRHSDEPYQAVPHSILQPDLPWAWQCQQRPQRHPWRGSQRQQHLNKKTHSPAHCGPSFPPGEDRLLGPVTAAAVSVAPFTAAAALAAPKAAAPHCCAPNRPFSDGGFRQPGRCSKQKNQRQSDSDNQTPQVSEFGAATLTS